MKFKITSIEENPYDRVEIEYPSMLDRVKHTKNLLEVTKEFVLTVSIAV